MAASLVFIIFALALHIVVLRNTVHASTPYSALEDRFRELSSTVRNKGKVMNDVDVALIASIKESVLQYCKDGILCVRPGLQPPATTDQRFAAKFYMLARPKDHEKYYNWLLPSVDCDTVYARKVQEKTDLELAREWQYDEINNHQSSLHGSRREGDSGTLDRRKQLARGLRFHEAELDKTSHQQYKTPLELVTGRRDELVDDHVIAKVLQEQEIKAKSAEILENEFEMRRKQLEQIKKDRDLAAVLQDKTRVARAYILSQQNSGYQRGTATSGRYNRPDSLRYSELVREMLLRYPYVRNKHEPSYNGHDSFSDTSNGSPYTWQELERRRAAALQQQALDRWRRARAVPETRRDPIV